MRNGLDVETIRERLSLYGWSSLSVRELLATVVGVARVDGVLDGLSDERWLLVAGIDELVQRGFTRRQAEMFRAAVELALQLWQRAQYHERYHVCSPKAAYELLRPLVMEFPYQEQFFSVPLDSKNRILCVRRVALGTVNAAYVSAREVYRIAIQHSASCILTAHNHPSGDPRPSPEDIALVRGITIIGETLDIPHLDHIILGDGVFTSLREEGRMRG